MENNQLFALIDSAYQEDLSNQPAAYRQALLKSAEALMAGTDEFTVCADFYQVCHNNFIVPMSLPTANRSLYQFIEQTLKNTDQKRLRDLNLGYGLIATHFTFGPLN